MTDTDLLFLEAYDGQTTDELIALEDGYRIDSIVLAFEIALGDKPNPSTAERVILAVEAIEREVNNGGFNQFFVNSSCELAPYIVDAFRLIDCPKTAELCARAIALLNVTDLTDADALENAAYDADDDEDLMDQFNALDSEYYEGEEEPLAGKLFEYIKQNRADISLEHAQAGGTRRLI